jgi:hypothetical protein
MNNTGVIGDFRLPRTELSKRYVSIEKLHKAITEYNNDKNEIMGCAISYLESFRCPTYSQCETCAILHENMPNVLTLIKKATIEKLKEI